MRQPGPVRRAETLVPCALWWGVTNGLEVPARVAARAPINSPRGDSSPYWSSSATAHASSADRANSSRLIT
jgi:hypothetical protein